MDVRDVARAFVLGLEKEEAGGERFIIRGGGATWQDFSECVSILLGSHAELTWMVPSRCSASILG